MRQPSAYTHANSLNRSVSGARNSRENVANLRDWVIHTKDETPPASGYWAPAIVLCVTLLSVAGIACLAFGLMGPVAAHLHFLAVG